MPDIKVLGQVDSIYILAETKKRFDYNRPACQRMSVYFLNLSGINAWWFQELIVPINLELDPERRSNEGNNTLTWRVSAFGYLNSDMMHLQLQRSRISWESLKTRHGPWYNIRYPFRGKSKRRNRDFDRVTKSIACRSALKAGAIVLHPRWTPHWTVFRTENPYTCPHGSHDVSFNRQNW